ncbi:hypothetical protein B0H21DRAFT_807509 [Amylocystis lapponica]|nr:hypothetical protein B0H21DRAFT_807509 [Amylocystis lapponica]
MAAHQRTDNLPIEAVAECHKQAKRDGLFAGVSSALASVILGSKLFRLNRNATLVCGAVTGVLAGYQFTQAFLSSNLARLRAEQAQLLRQQQPDPKLT